MRIEVITPDGSTNTEKGDLLENLAGKLLITQSYKVKKKIRVTASELDLLCKHKVSGKEIYVECKAHKDPLSANVLKNLLGEIEFHDYSEGWLISTGPLGKDAKGFVEEWGKKQRDKREKLSFYEPDKVITALKDAHLLSEPSESFLKGSLGDEFSIGDWTLLVSPWGNFWACPKLENGIPKGVLLFNALSGKQIDDDDLFVKIKNTNTSFKELEFSSQKDTNKTKNGSVSGDSSAIVEVEYGERWTDYRPSRPEHFVGRNKARRSLLSFFTNVKKRNTETRVFAVKGDSGIGKSSLIAKMRQVANISKKPNKLFFYAVDIRAASDSSYIYSSLLSALRSASQKGFGTNNNLKVSNYSDPLQSDSIRKFLTECERKHELIILVFDQFEELYSKSTHFPVFEEAKKLMFSTIAASTSLVLGFAWKTDSTVPQDHPAYHMWHQLSDHRYEIPLIPFSHADAEKSMNLFEEELGEKIRSELRKYLVENSQGYPWLLKKLCIHLYEQFQSGVSQHQLVDRALDIASLFDRDLNNLTDAETACLKLVAEHAPMDWYEVLGTATPEVVQSLQNKRLVIRSGDKLNLYWDIFRNYVLFNEIPIIPFTYIPQSTSIEALLRTALQLDPMEPKSIRDLSAAIAFKESTVRNIIHDLEQFGIASVSTDKIILDSHIKEISARFILSRIRFVFKRHGLVKLLEKNNSTKIANLQQIIQYLKQLNPTAQHHSRTWDTYANKMCSWMSVLGYILCSDDSVLYKDIGDILEDEVRQLRGKRQKTVFIGDTSPARVIEALNYIKIQGACSYAHMKSTGFRNACNVLHRFRLVELTTAHYYKINKCMFEDCSMIEAVWGEAQKEDSIKYAIEYLTNNPTASFQEVGKCVAKHFERSWVDESCKRVGSGLIQWAIWLMARRNENDPIPKPSGKVSSKNINDKTPTLF